MCKHACPKPPTSQSGICFHDSVSSYLSFEPLFRQRAVHPGYHQPWKLKDYETTGEQPSVHQLPMSRPQTPVVAILATIAIYPSSSALGTPLALPQ
ncbi:hypothetical protein O988_03780 [Pseudogymnoascus sp. VKM F-3808]|nr:hypothetical protein O988_03780 [Pseudogymnoascus sp. VKM F-3808]